MIISKFNNKTGLLETKFEGEVTINEIVDYLHSIQENKTYPRVLKIITDATNADMNFTPGDIRIMIEKKFKTSSKYEFIVIAMIVSKPKETAFSILYHELTKAKIKNHRCEIFSTKDAALHFLNNF